MNIPFPCPESDLLQAILRGTLSEEDEQRITVHLESCVSCRRAVDMIAGVDGDAAILAESGFHSDLMSTVLSEREGASLEPELCAIMERLKADAPLESVTSTGCTHRESHTILSEMDAFIQQLVNESGGMPRIGHYELGEKIGRGGMGPFIERQTGS